MSKEEDILVAAKAECVPGESVEEHEVHREHLERAYAALAAAKPEDSNPAPVGETEITAEVVVTSEEPE